jgi:hypothetical protein
LPIALYLLVEAFRQELLSTQWSNLMNIFKWQLQAKMFGFLVGVMKGTVELMALTA